MPLELQVQIVIWLCQHNSTKQSPLWSCTSCKKEKCWRNSRWIFSLVLKHSYLTGMKCSNECGKTLWIISLVNNWEAWWEHHVARRLNFPGEFNILYQYHCISTLLPRNGSVLYPPIQEEMVIRRNIALGPCILNFSKLKALCIVSSAKK